MACTVTLNGLKRDCSSNIGGLKKVWIAPYVENAAVFAAEDDQVISTIAGTTGEQKTFKAYAFARNTASMTSTLNKDLSNGTSYVSTEIVLQFNKMEAAKRLEIASLAVGDVMLIVQDNNGKIWFLGKDAPVEASTGVGQSGAAKSEGNFYNITLTDESFGFPYEVKADVIKDLESAD